MNNNSVLGVQENNCSGCGTCFQKCPKSCITMVENERGFLMPSVDSGKCVQCGICVKSCPEICDTDRNPEIKSFAAVAKNKDMLNVSTSGGVFGLISRRILSDGGVVYGCAWKKNNTVEHIRVDKEEDLPLIQQSKYLQSDTARTFAQVKADLESGRAVLYSSTACQIAGLEHFLGKRYEKLYTVEVACHGVPSPGLFRKYCSWLGKKNGSVVKSFRFRSKDRHKKGEHYRFTVEFENGSRKSFLSWEDPYYGSFLSGRTLRATCYHCKYKSNERVADILLADYWGIEKEHPDFPAMNGASAVVITTEKGSSLISSVQDELIIEPTSFAKITAHNQSIVSSAEVSKDLYVEDISAEDDKLFAMLKPKFNIKRKLRNLVPERVKYLIKRI